MKIQHSEDRSKWLCKFQRLTHTSGSDARLEGARASKGRYEDVITAVFSIGLRVLDHLCCAAPQPRRRQLAGSVCDLQHLWHGYWGTLQGGP